MSKSLGIAFFHSRLTFASSNQLSAYETIGLFRIGSRALGETWSPCDVVNGSSLYSGSETVIEGVTEIVRTDCRSLLR